MNDTAVTGFRAFAQRWQAEIRWAAWSAAAGAAIGAIVYARFVIVSGSAGGLPGYVRMPAYLLAGASLGFAWGCSLGWLMERRRFLSVSRPAVLLAGLVVMALPLPGLVRLHDGLTLRHAIDTVALMNADELDRYCTDERRAQNYFVARAIAANGLAGPALIDRMARNAPDDWYEPHEESLFGLNGKREPRWSTMAILVRHRNITPDTLRFLAEMPQAMRVMDGVLEHPKAPIELLRRFGERPDHDTVRFGLSGNRNTPPEVLDRLASSPEAHNRARVAGNPSTPTATLRRLVWDEHYQVREVAARALDLRRR